MHHAHSQLLPVAGAEATPDVEVQSETELDHGWGVIVWNDPVNLMSYVVHVFKIVLKMDAQQARKHMLEVHEKGKSLVAVENKERAEFLAHRLQSYGLKATMEPV